MVRVRRPAQRWPEPGRVASKLKMPLRYGENPHQQAALYLPGRSGRRRHRPGRRRSRARSSATTISTTPMPRSSSPPSSATATPTVVIVKHANPCGVATGDPARRLAPRRSPATASRPSAGSSPPTARSTPRPPRRSREIFTEVVVAPDADDDARAVFAKKKNLRLLLTGELPDPARAARRGADHRRPAGPGPRQRHGPPRRAQGVTRRAADRAGARRLPVRLDRRQARQVERHRLCQGRRDRRHRRRPDEPPRQRASPRSRRARRPRPTAGPEPRTVGSAVASDAFFPFADGLLAAAEAGATAVIQPGGSIRDEEVIAAADEAGLPCCSPACGTSATEQRGRRPRCWGRAGSAPRYRPCSCGTARGPRGRSPWSRGPRRRRAGSPGCRTASSAQLGGAGSQLADDRGGRGRPDQRPAPARYRCAQDQR